MTLKPGNFTTLGGFAKTIGVSGLTLQPVQRLQGVLKPRHRTTVRCGGKAAVSKPKQHFRRSDVPVKKEHSFLPDVTLEQINFEIL